MLLYYGSEILVEVASARITGVVFLPLLGSLLDAIISIGVGWDPFPNWINYYACDVVRGSYIIVGRVESKEHVDPNLNYLRNWSVMGDVVSSGTELDSTPREAEGIKIDTENKKVYCNTLGVVENCHFLKEIQDAQRIHRSVIDFFECSTTL
ncbi:hypothetical protein CK203_021014 [Vitis vinifera]|uniref:Uncharacterized protein n=1 Tax=Vitis vinifera TaxID=29760 RepID=A0A438JWN1_VITVI|nr:hypothetical protein CK203_021014 [Vitis vinifera]